MKIRIPCTTANLGVLFDKGGIALDAFFNDMVINEASETSIKIIGEGISSLPRDKSNLVCKAISRFYALTGTREPDYNLNMVNRIPLSRGLGSSAACIAGGLYAANAMSGYLLEENELIQIAAEMEGHGDNVCPAFMGGITLYNKDSIRSFDFSDDLAFILYIPENELSTKHSRAVLPKEYPEETKKKAELLEMEMTDALEAKDYEKAGHLMEQDVIHQPYRKKLIPFWDEVISAAGRAGVHGTALSGAGPSMISMCSKADMKTIMENLRDSIDKNHGLNIIGCEICREGLIALDGGDHE